MKTKKTNKGSKAIKTVNPPIGYVHLQYLANKKGLPFTLSMEEYSGIYDNVCDCCGTVNKGNNITLAIKDIAIGYTKDNCIPLCSTCAKMKGNKDYSLFIANIKEIYIYQLYKDFMKHIVFGNMN